MTQKEKNLVFKDLCGRLFYNVYAEVQNHHLVMHTYLIEKINMHNGWTEGILDCAGRKQFYAAKVEDVKPYLRPMSSMTEEEKKEVEEMAGSVICYNENEGGSTLFDEVGLDWLNKSMFDYRGLIKKGLAIEVTKENNPYEKEQKEK